MIVSRARCGSPCGSAPTAGPARASIYNAGPGAPFAAHAFSPCDAVVAHG
jgi:hypothetical protein